MKPSATALAMLALLALCLLSNAYSPVAEAAADVCAVMALLHWGSCENCMKTCHNVIRDNDKRPIEVCHVACFLLDDKCSGRLVS